MADDKYVDVEGMSTALQAHAMTLIGPKPDGKPDEKVEMTFVRLVVPTTNKVLWYKGYGASDLDSLDDDVGMTAELERVFQEQQATLEREMKV